MKEQSNNLSGVAALFILVFMPIALPLIAGLSLLADKDKQTPAGKEPEVKV